ncbi:hypothetical protein [Burkholderia territorii]|uniref:hypothetical protein n=1 Tax=Burkholderia territorii TaxID=1503055 RepID=UPI0007B9BD5C|nr:hypothetical protein [Burkholderia territorii]
MSVSCTIELHADGIWHDVGVVTLFGEPEEGWRSRAYTGYDVEWVVRHQFARDAHAMACGFPVDLEPLVTPHWPAFLIDLLPQGVRASEAKAGDAHAALDRDALRVRLQAMAPSLREIAGQGVDLGLEPDVHAFLKPGIERLARELDALR